MRYTKWLIRIILAAIILAFLDYTLPAYDVVRLVGTEVVRTDIEGRSLFWAGGDSVADASGTRDIRFINAERENGNPRVYRNEDTGWGWPPFFKFDSGDLQAAAQSSEGGWVVMTHYGWRSTLVSIYPNAIGFRLVTGPEASPVNWFRIIFAAVFLVAIFVVRRWLRRFSAKLLNAFSRIKQWRPWRRG